MCRMQPAWPLPRGALPWSPAPPLTRAHAAAQGTVRVPTTYERAPLNAPKMSASQPAIAPLPALAPDIAEPPIRLPASGVGCRGLAHTCARLNAAACGCVQLHAPACSCMRLRAAACKCMRLHAAHVTCAPHACWLHGLGLNSYSQPDTPTHAQIHRTVPSSPRCSCQQRSRCQQPPPRPGRGRRPAARARRRLAAAARCWLAVASRCWQSWQLSPRQAASRASRRRL